MNTNPLSVSTFSNSLNNAASINLVNQSIVDYVYNASVSSCVYGSRQYNKTFSLSLKAVLIDNG